MPSTGKGRPCKGAGSGTACEHVFHVFRGLLLIPFLLLLGIAADALGFLVLALSNPLREIHLAGGMGLRLTTPEMRDLRYTLRVINGSSLRL